MPIIKNQIGAEVRKRLMDIQDIKKLSETSDKLAREAKIESAEAKSQSVITQKQLDEAVLSGTPIEEVQQAHVNADGKVFNTLVDRLNAGDAVSKNLQERIEAKDPVKFTGSGDNAGYAKIGEFSIDAVGHKQFSFEWACAAGEDTSAGHLTGTVRVLEMGVSVLPENVLLSNAPFSTSNDVNGYSFILIETLVSEAKHTYALYVELTINRTFLFNPILENNLVPSWAMTYAKNGDGLVYTLPEGAQYRGSNPSAGSVRPEYFGASPESSASKNRSSIQRALDIGGEVHLGSSGVYRIDAPLEIGDNTHFKLGSEVVIRLSPGIKSNMLVNKGYKDGSRNKNIKISGGTWDYDEANRDYDNENPLNTMAIIMKGVDELSIKDVRGFNAKKYMFLLSDITYLSVDDLFFNTHSDGLHLQGPVAKADIRNLKGTTGDDMLAFTIGDFSYYELTRGDFTDINVYGLYPNNSLTAVKITGNSPYKFKNITLSEIKGTVKNQAIFVMKDENLLYTDVDTLTVNDLDVDSADVATHHAIHIKDSIVNNLKVDGIVHKPGNNCLVCFDGTSSIGRAEIKGIRSEIGFTYRVIRVVSSVNVKSLLVDGVIASLGAGGELVQTEGIVGLITLNNADCTLGTGAKVLSHAVNKVDLIQLNNIKWVGGNAVYSQLAATPSGSIVEASNIFGKSTENGFSFRGAGALHLENVALDTVSNVPVNITDSVAVVDIYGDMQFDDGDDKEHIKYLNGATGIVRGLGLRLDVSTAKKDRTSMCFNRNAALSCGIGPVICNGTNWKNLYTGATY